MGDFVEGSGGLVLQMTLDRRVVVFGRGRVLLERREGVSGAGDEAVQTSATGEGAVGDVAVLGGVDSEEGVLVKPVPKWPKRDRKTP